MKSDLEAARAGRRLYRLHTSAGVLAGLSLAASAFGFVRVAATIAFLVVLAIVASLETMRVLFSYDRSPRR